MQAAGIEEAGERGGHGGKDQHAEPQAIHIDAGGAGGARIVAGCQHMGAERRLAIDEMADRDADHRPEDQRGDAEQCAGAEDRRIDIIGDRHRLQVGQPAADTGEEAHRGERHEEGRQAHIGDQRAIDEADQRARSEAGGDADRPGHRAHHYRRDQRRDGDHRADRKVDLAGGQHEHHADRHDRDRRRLLDDVDEVVGGQEAVVPEHHREGGEDQQESDIDDILGRIEPLEGQRLRRHQFTPSEAGGSR